MSSMELAQWMSHSLLLVSEGINYCILVHVHTVICVCCYTHFLTCPYIQQTNFQAFPLPICLVCWPGRCHVAKIYNLEEWHTTKGLWCKLGAVAHISSKPENNMSPYNSFWLHVTYHTHFQTHPHKHTCHLTLALWFVCYGVGRLQMVIVCELFTTWNSLQNSVLEKTCLGL